MQPGGPDGFWSLPFGALLRDHRRVAGLTQEELATRSGLSVRAVADMERGRTARPHQRSVELLAQALELSGDDHALFARAARAAWTGAGGPPAPRSPADLPAARRPAVPCQLPAAGRYFAGREAEIGQLTGWMDEPGDAGTVLITVIAGSAGVGKTALAVHWARQHVAVFPDGQLYVDLCGFAPARDPVSPAEALGDFLDALRVPAAQIPATLDGRQALYRSLLAGQRILVVLDNARDPAQVRPLLPGSPGCMAVITSRSELTGLIGAGDACLLTLDVLTVAEARQLLAARLGAARLAAEPAATAELIAQCARLPLALAITAARAAARPRFPLTVLAAELRDARGRLDVLATGEDATDPRAVFSWSYQQLSPAAARMFRLIGLHPGPDITVDAAASLAGVRRPEARGLLLELTRGHLLAEPVPGRHAFHDLLRAYAAGQATVAEDEQARRAAIGRMLDHYLHTAYAAALLLKPSREAVILTPPRPGVTPELLADHHQALDWFEAEHRVLLAVLAVAVETGFDGCAWQLPTAMADFLDRRGHWHESAAIQRTALAAATRLGDTAGRAMAGRALGTVCAWLTDYDQARTLMTDSLGLYRELGDRGGQARVHQSLAWVAGCQGCNTNALAHAEQALRLFRATANRAGQAAALNAVGWCHAALGDPQRARAFCRQALALNQELGLLRDEASAWDSLGYAEHRLGRHSDAVGCYDSALRLFRELGDRFNEAAILTHLGDARHAAHERQEARDAWQQALDILDDLRHPDADQVRARLLDPGTGSRAELADRR